ncbi:MAG: glutamine synthetase family protein [Alphaproteobacteria bacterium]|nr:glutamine synthetase family protein [Alphaproteobacteria bacterium]MDX5368585.1 glutamine synthetase family protein [Alphaproteobacteria bacterium]MDX5463330.1 glutamine synthetase family protein [Alphaproteobacteria bacterium]
MTDAAPSPQDTRDRLAAWLAERQVSEVECIVADMNGLARGKILPTKKFLDTFDERSLRLPESIFLQTVTGDMIDSEVLSETEPDVVLLPDADTIRLVPWYDEPTAQIICDAVYKDGGPVTVAPRQVLKRILALYAQRGWQPIVAPEVEFYLCQKNVDPDYPLVPPIGKSGRQENARQPYGIDAVNEFDPLFEDVYDYCEEQAIDIDTLIHEAGAAQCEINFNHGEPLSLADQTFLFKRTVRQAALRHDVYATFMAKPYQGEPGSAMHIHQSILDVETGRNLFSTPAGKDTALFKNYVGGLQKYLPGAMPLIAPNVNSYRRLIRDLSAPVNTHWGRENRTVGLRVPDSRPANRRVENRVPGADANPYLAIAATLACGYLGMRKRLKPTPEMTKSAYLSQRYALPRHILDALQKLKSATELREVLGPDFVQVYLEVKLEEHHAYQQVISAWEREHLLLNV